MALSSTAVAIRTATLADADLIAATLVDAFLDTPDARWLIPDRRARMEVYRQFCSALVGHTLSHAIIDIAADGDGVALWHPHTGVPLGTSGSDPLAAMTGGPHAGRFRQLEATFADHHPRAAHHYLAYLAVAPARQRRGIGSALLAHHHATLDADAVPAYLVAVSPESRDLYRRHGYQPHGEVFHLPDDGPPMFPMWRAPVRTSPGQDVGR